MKKYDKTQSFKCDKELDLFLKSLSKKSNFIRVAILEKIERENLLKKDKRKKATLLDLQNSFSIFENEINKESANLNSDGTYQMFVDQLEVID